MHNLDVHRKAGISRRKISSFLSNLLENEILFSSDSECEYQITTTVRRIAKIKPEIASVNSFDDDSTNNRITRSSAFMKREPVEVDRIDGGDSSKMPCYVCGFIGLTEQMLKEHAENEHGIDVVSGEISFSSDISKQGYNNPSIENGCILQPEQTTEARRSKKFSCEICGKHFKQKAALVKHMQMHCPIDDTEEVEQDNQNSDISDAYDTDDSEVIDSKAKSTSGFPCNVCGKIYEKKDHILRHFKTFHPHDDDALTAVIDIVIKHEGDGFPCTSCPTVHSNRDSLRRHLRKVHRMPNRDSDNKSTQFTCDICGKMFNRPKCFATHMKKHSETVVEKRRVKNPKKKTHLCSFCGKSYPGSNHLKIHLRIHTGERPFKCQYCDKTFAIKKTWQDHTYSHTGEKPYCCPVENCGKRFTHSTGVRQHMQCCHSSEKQFQCPHCDKKCSKKTHLEDHIRSHTGERPYECKYCGIRFRLTSTLRIHHRTHTGERPFVCKVCNRGFIKSYGLKQHLKSKRNCLPTTAQPTLIPEIEQIEHQPQDQLQQATIDNTVSDDVQFHQLLILPPHQVLS
ncbi:hypothetical protein HA402_009188 [Bradysia odoriphaga]|nr:hypothetical protein HA402_009188 [Bradysia odoriphaga]